VTDKIEKRTRLRMLRIDRVDLVDRGAAIGARITLTKRRDRAEKEHPKMPTLDEILAKLSEAERAVVETALRASAAPPKEAEKMGEPGEPPKLEDAVKRLDPRIAAEVVELRKRAESSEAEIAKLRDAESTRVAVAKAETVKAGAIGLALPEVAEIYKRSAAKEPLPDELVAKLHGHFAATAAVVAKSALFKEHGAPGAVDAESPAAQMEAIAKSIKAADPKLSEIEARIAAYKSNPELYAQLRNG
jgi:hypothetical protein